LCDRIVIVVKIVDASALGALLFGEPAADTVADRLRGSRLVAPTLLGYELTSICLNKIRGNPEAHADFFAALAVWDQMGIEIVATDHLAILLLAERCGLTAYDASYLWLAQRLNAELVTLDRPLGRAAAALGLGPPP
jgi:predicted nucleic acid-binding protein